MISITKQREQGSLEFETPEFNYKT